jgi:hypothetical protein
MVNVICGSQAEIQLHGSFELVLLEDAEVA